MSKENEEPETEILDPTMYWMNEKKEVVFAIKRKGLLGPVYYIFEKHEDRIDPKNRDKFHDFWELIRYTAKKIGIPLYDVAEMKLLYKKATDKYVKETGKVPPDYPEQVDISVPVYDHASETLHHIVIGVSKMKAEEAEKKFKKRR